LARCGESTRDPRKNKLLKIPGNHGRPLETTGDHGSQTTDHH
jgi:hypothetical protein